MSAWTEARSFGDVWAETVAASGDTPFLIFEAPTGDVTQWTYAEFDSVVARMATELASHGVGAGDIPLFEIDEADGELAWLPTEPFTDWPTIGVRHRAGVMFTSGTTGRPKGVEITEANYAFAGRVMAQTDGLQAPGCLVDVHDVDGTAVAPGGVGEIVVGGERGITLFAGYLDDPETTAASFAGGWFRTGDRSRRDVGGRHYFDGRRADVLKVAGENVSTVEVEQVLAAHPGVLEAAVIGMPDAVRDEVPVAFVVAASAALLKDPNAETSSPREGRPR